MASLERTGQSINRQIRMAHCGCKAWVMHNAERGYRIQASYCRDRFCPRCSHTRSRVAAAGINRMCEGKEVRFVTLTLRHTEATLTQQLDRLHECFKQFRRRRWWRDRVDGGCSAVEIKKSKRGSWHVHMHMLVTGKYLPQKQLSAEWHATTGDSHIVDVRAVDGPRAVHYVAKYVGKPADTETLQNDDDHDILVQALKGRRSLLTFGTFHGVDDDDDEPPVEWRHVAPLDDIYEKARRGCRAEREIINALRPGTTFAHLHQYSHDPP